MKYTQFIEGCKHAKELDKYVANHVTKTYMPYAEKIANASRIVELSSYATDGSGRRFQENSPLRYALYVRMALEYYTDISFEEDKFTDVYDALAAEGLVEPVLDGIGQDLIDFQTTLHMVHDDMLINERDIASFIEGKIDALATMLEAASEQLASSAGDEQSDKTIELPVE